MVNQPYNCPVWSVQTVAGIIPASELGLTQCHEHVYLAKGRSYECNPDLLIDDVDRSVREVMAYREAGGCSLVDAQPVGCGRSAAALTGISQRARVNIIASTGFHKMCFYPEGHWIKTLSEDELTEIFIEELTVGMLDGTDAMTASQILALLDGYPESNGIHRIHYAPAGIIKTVWERCGLDELYSKLFSAAVSAKLQTGAPMQVHIEKGSKPEDLIDYLQDRHIDLSSVYFCHMDRACDQYETFIYVLDAGGSLEFDTIGRFKYHSDEEEISLIKKLLADGWEDRLLFSLDTTRARLKAYNNQAVGLNYIIETFIPALSRAGVSKDIVDRIMIKNPARILGR